MEGGDEVAGDAGLASDAFIFDDETFGPELAQEGGGFGSADFVAGVHGGEDGGGVGGIGAAPGVDEEAVGAGDLEHVTGVQVADAHGGHGDDVGGFEGVEVVEDGGAERIGGGDYLEVAGQAFGDGQQEGQDPKGAQGAAVKPAAFDVAPCQG